MPRRCRCPGYGPSSPRRTWLRTPYPKMGQGPMSSSSPKPVLCGILQTRGNSTTHISDRELPLFKFSLVTSFLFLFSPAVSPTPSPPPQPSPTPSRPQPWKILRLPHLHPQERDLILLLLVEEFQEFLSECLWLIVVGLIEQGLPSLHYIFEGSRHNHLGKQRARET